MLYIHTLKDLSPKCAEIEVIPLIRDIKINQPYPLSEEKVKENFSAFAVSNSDIQSQMLAFELVPSTVEEIKSLIQSDGQYETVNVQRAIAALQEMPPALQKNIEYCQQILVWQEMFLERITPLLSSIPKLRTLEEKQDYDKKLSAIFEMILRTKDFRFHFDDIVNEAQVARMTALIESMEHGFLFPVKLEEHLKQERFDEIKERIPQEELDRVSKITQSIKDISKGVQRAYDNNMRMIQMAVHLYAYIKAMR